MTPADTLARLPEIRARNEARIKGISSEDVDALLALVEWQQGEIERYRNTLETVQGMATIETPEIMRVVVDALRDASNYLVHDEECRGHSLCTCGLDALRKRIEEAVG